MLRSFTDVEGKDVQPHPSEAPHNYRVPFLVAVEAALLEQ